MRFRIFTGYKDYPYGEFILVIGLNRESEIYLIDNGYSGFGTKNGRKAFKVDQ